MISVNSCYSRPGGSGVGGGTVRIKYSFIHRLPFAETKPLTVQSNVQYSSPLSSMLSATRLHPSNPAWGVVTLHGGLFLGPNCGYWTPVGSGPNQKQAPVAATPQTKTTPPAKSTGPGTGLVGKLGAGGGVGSFGFGTGNGFFGNSRRPCESVSLRESFLLKLYRFRLPSSPIGSRFTHRCR